MSIFRKGTIKTSKPEPDASGFVKGTLEWYAWAWDSMTFDLGYEYSIEKMADLLLSGRERYEIVSSITKVPWYVIGAIHAKESSCDFRGILHNGEKIIGTGALTRLVPKGRGPFVSWEGAAVDALRLLKFDQHSSWTIEECLQRGERYNGLGYLKHHPEENSPYLWACTSINDDHGKYVSDGKFDPNAPTNKHPGFAAILKWLAKIEKIQVSRIGATNG